MPRYILVDNNSGYIWGDTADIGGKIAEVSTPIDAARALDESLGVYGRRYDEVGKHDLSHSTATGYHVYCATVGGSEAVSVIRDGQDREMIEAVERDCEYVASVLCRDAEGAIIHD